MESLMKTKNIESKKHLFSLIILSYLGSFCNGVIISISLSISIGIATSYICICLAGQLAREINAETHMDIDAKSVPGAA